MDIKPRLIQLLINMPATQTVGERKALLSIAGFDYLIARINSLEKSNHVFFSELVELVFYEGQAQLLKFINALAASGLVGLEVKGKLNDFIAEIAAVDTQQWNRELINFNRNQPVSIPSTPMQSAGRLEEEQDTKLIIPSILGTKAFEFTVVMVDAQGKEINCHRRQNHYLTEDLGNRVTLEMVYIPGGEFLMGSPESEGKRYSNERPRHSVTVKPFFMSKHPITQAQWREVANWSEVRQKLKKSPSRNGGKSHPISQISWFDAVEFCDRLSGKTGHSYRLPTEAEWEYACRAGTTTPFHFGETITSDLANYDGSYLYGSEKKGIYREKTTPVGSLQVANSFGLFDMHGLVWEWCLDHWHNNYNNAPTNEDAWLDSSENQIRVMRGGSWLNDPYSCRSSSRLQKNASDKSNNIGFRIVYSL
ncbi:formylglycine-generating enzyme family protein [Plectonema radiosum NIES-515]|uniref:Formylglycine-generating enzyme family protein n=1 Tax=Plectonema radiosum NIES-515 TaxID=2986073 RepID=A0ABT3B2P8_9CYAN|nr:formylglycine-generating enzyme family protein [Plectonema radiosum]MCV3215638.1 formylglycine-generating enzyme family protein [Plectonema radiosum NIES-515]